LTKAQSAVLGALYGVGTGVTVTGATSISRGSAAAPPQGGGPGAQIEMGPSGYELCDSSGTSCKSAAGRTAVGMASPYLGFSASKVAEVARLHDVAAAAGGITLLESSLTFPESGGAAPRQAGYTIDGVDTADASLGPLSAASLTSGHSFTAAGADSDVAVVDSGYAQSHGLKTGSAVSIDQVRYTVIGIVSQPQGSNPPAIYVPLARAQAMSLQPSASLKNDVNTIYVAAASAAGIPAVQKVALAVGLALAGGLLAGAFGSWRIARLRPADALARVA
jgi:ABC-type antimicrobial peptide transport system permease subunit